jgi:hypothetical protein
MSFGYANIIANGAKYRVFPCKSMWEGHCFVGFFFNDPWIGIIWAMDKTPNIYYWQKKPSCHINEGNYYLLEETLHKMTMNIINLKTS